MNFKKRVNGSWTDTPHYIHKTDTDILTTLPAVLYPTGSTATVGLKGNTLQSSIPSPTSPVMPQGTGERTGNLWNAIKYSYTSLSDSRIWGYSSSLTGSVYRVPCMPNTKYTLYLAENVSISIWRICEVSTDAVPNASSTSVPTTGAYATAVPASKSATFTTSASAKYILFQTNETAYDLVLPVIMLVEGTTKIPYEPYGYKIPISSAGQTTPVYLGEVQTTRKIKKLVLDGTGNWSAGTENFYRFIDNFGEGIPYSNVICTHTQHSTINNTGKALFMKISDFSPISSVADFKAYLAAQYAAGTPVTVWYVLATETTGIVNEPIRKIGDYADTVSGITIPTIAGANTLSVGTTVQPSEVSVNYKGWHPVQSVHERENGQWD